MYAADGIVANAVQIGSTSIILLDNAKHNFRETFAFWFRPALGSLMWIEIARNDTGVSDGGLIAVQPSVALGLLGWNACAVATLSIYQ
jgi:hypothetical protein